MTCGICGTKPSIAFSLPISEGGEPPIELGIRHIYQCDCGAVFYYIDDWRPPGRAIRDDEDEAA
jgi:hypothetical protein